LVTSRKMFNRISQTRLNKSLGWHILWSLLSLKILGRLRNTSVIWW